MNSKLHKVTDAAGRPLRMFLTAGQQSDYIVARCWKARLPPNTCWRTEDTMRTGLRIP